MCGYLLISVDLACLYVCVFVFVLHQNERTLTDITYKVSHEVVQFVYSHYYQFYVLNA